MPKEFSSNTTSSNQNHGICLQIDEKGRIVLPPEMKTQYGLKPGAKVYLSAEKNGLRIRNPSQLLKLYIEPTNRCNLNCRTCIRHNWTDPVGMMSDDTFSRAMKGLSQIHPRPTVFFGGFGEPLSHPKIVQMIATVKGLGASAELITNGTLLTPELSQRLTEAGIDVLWVSIDGATQGSYSCIRPGASLPQVLENVANFHNTIKSKSIISDCGVFPGSRTKLGIAFVATKRNIADLPKILKLARDFEARHLIVTNVLPHTREMCDELLYDITSTEDLSPETVLRINIPRIDMTETTRTPLYEIMRYGTNVSWAGSNFESVMNSCPFIESGAGVIGWDGSFTPCLSLLHSHTSFVFGRERFSKKWIIGNLEEKSLSDLWNDPEHISFRERVQSFDFAPCTSCGGCELAESNEEDCWGNDFPTCGGCLWAQGLIQCP